MFLINLLLLLCFVLICLISGLIALKKAVMKKAINLVLLFVSFGASSLILGFGALNFIGDFVLTLLEGNIEGLGSLGTASALIVGLVNFLVDVILFDLLFWIIYGFLKLVCLIIISATPLKTKTLFKKPENGKTGAVSAVLAGVTTWFFCIFSLLPLFAISSLVTPALNEASKEEYSDTYAYEIAQVVNEKYSFLTDASFVNKAATVTGARGLINLSLNAFGDVEIEENGVITECNVYDLLKDVTALGTDGVIAYEMAVAGGHTYKDMQVLVGVMDVCSNSPSLASLATSVISSELVPNEQDTVLGEILNCVTVQFTGEHGAENFSNDLMVIRNLLNDFIEKNADKEFVPEHIADDLLEYLLDKNNADDIVNNLSSLSSFKDVTAVLSSYGVYSICEMMDIPANKEGAFNSLYQDLITELNDKSYNRVNFEDLDEFIKYLSANQIPVSEYKEQNKNTETGEDDVAIVNYEGYFNRTQKIVNVFDKYGVEEFDDTRTYVLKSGDIYVYDKENDLWSKLDSQTIKNPFLLAEYLIKKVDLVIDNGEFSEENVKTALLNFATEYSGKSAYATFNANFAEKIRSLDNFTTSLITEEEILSKIDKTADVSGGAEPLKEILISASIVLNLGDGDANVFETLLNNFGQVGKVLDALGNYGITKSVPETLLKAIAQREEVSAYFKYDSIIKITENVKNGTSTYEELFVSIESLYKIANELI